MKPSRSFMTLHAASLKLGITVYGALRLIAARELRVKRAGKHLFVRIADVQRLLDARR